jgi:hypothetical protein
MRAKTSEDKRFIEQNFQHHVHLQKKKLKQLKHLASVNAESTGSVVPGVKNARNSNDKSSSKCGTQDDSTNSKNVSMKSDSKTTSVSPDSTFIPATRQSQKQSQHKQKEKEQDRMQQSEHDIERDINTTQTTYLAAVYGITTGQQREFVVDVMKEFNEKVYKAAELPSSTNPLKKVQLDENGFEIGRHAHLSNVKYDRNKDNQNVQHEALANAAAQAVNAESLNCGVFTPLKHKLDTVTDKMKLIDKLIDLGNQRLPMQVCKSVTLNPAVTPLVQDSNFSDQTIQTNQFNHTHSANTQSPAFLPSVYHCDASYSGAHEGVPSLRLDTLTHQYDSSAASSASAVNGGHSHGVHASCSKLAGHPLLRDRSRSAFSSLSSLTQSPALSPSHRGHHNDVDHHQNNQHARYNRNGHQHDITGRSNTARIPSRPGLSYISSAIKPQSTSQSQSHSSSSSSSYAIRSTHTSHSSRSAHMVSVSASARRPSSPTSSAGVSVNKSRLARGATVHLLRAQDTEQSRVRPEQLMQLQNKCKKRAIVTKIGKDLLTAEGPAPASTEAEAGPEQEALAVSGLVSEADEDWAAKNKSLEGYMANHPGPDWHVFSVEESKKTALASQTQSHLNDFNMLENSILSSEREHENDFRSSMTANSNDNNHSTDADESSLYKPKSLQVVNKLLMKTRSLNATHPEANYPDARKLDPWPDQPPSNIVPKHLKSKPAVTDMDTNASDNARAPARINTNI